MSTRGPTRRIWGPKSPNFFFLWPMLLQNLASLFYFVHRSSAKKKRSRRPFFNKKMDLQPKKGSRKGIPRGPPFSPFSAPKRAEKGRKKGGRPLQKGTPCCEQITLEKGAKKGAHPLFLKGFLKKLRFLRNPGGRSPPSIERKYLRYFLEYTSRLAKLKLALVLERGSR